MVKVSTYFAMTLGAFVFWQSMDKLHVWIALHQDEKSKNGLKRKWRSRGLEKSCFDKLKKGTLLVKPSLSPIPRTLPRYQDEL
ncbi:hypothetical protein LINPERPRIM_LOCUS36626 [Linum perenne]